MVIYYDEKELLRLTYRDGRIEERENSISSLIETHKEFNLIKEEATSKLMQKYSLTLKQAEDHIEKFW